MTPGSTADAHRVRLTRWLVALGCVVAAWTALGIPAHATYGARVTADEPQYLLSALSLAEDGNLDIADELGNEVYRSFHPVDLPRQTYERDDGQHLSPHDPLLPVLLAAPMGMGGWAAAKAAMAIIAGALAVATAWTAVRRFGVRPRIAIATVAIFSATAPLATYATQIYPEIPAALAVVVAVAALTGRLRAGGIAVALVAITALPWLSVKYAPVAATLAAMVAWRLLGRRALPAFVGVLAAAGVAYLLVHRAIYGGWTAYASGERFAQEGELSVMGSAPNYLGRSRRLVGLLVDDGFGLVVWMAGWLALPVGVGALVRRRAAGWWALLVPLGAGWFTATFVALTMHGWWWPGRQLVAVLPLGVVVIAMAADRSRLVRTWLLATGIAGLVTWLWTTVEAITRRRTLVVDFDRTVNPVVQLWRIVLPDGRSPTAMDGVLLCLWAVIVAALVVAGWTRASRDDALVFDVSAR